MSVVVFLATSATSSAVPIAARAAVADAMFLFTVASYAVVRPVPILAVSVVIRVFKSAFWSAAAVWLPASTALITAASNASSVVVVKAVPAFAAVPLTRSVDTDFTPKRPIPENVTSAAATDAVATSAVVAKT